MTSIAHKARDGREQPLAEHCQNVNQLAAKFAKPFGGEAVAAHAGMGHDAGKNTDGFQQYIQDPENNPKCPHSVLGAAICAMEQDAVSAEIIEGHHAGLHNMNDMKDNIDMAFKTRAADIQKAEECFPIKQYDPRTLLPAYAKSHKNLGMYSFVRMAYSCLVDADYLDTEAFMRRAPQRTYTYDSLSDIYDKLCSYVEPWIKSAEELKKKPFTQLSKEQQINLMRTDMLLQCFKAGELSAKGDVRTLSIPTGGAKTISSFAYAAAATKHDKDVSRIIVVTPYTSITSQTASVLRDIAGERNVLEHHSGYDFDDNGAGKLLKYASENYDVPIVVTTDVQLFESFYSNKPSKSRKLHNLVNSVIIFDEIQQLKTPFLLPCIRCIETLAVNYGCRIVLCTATQPAIEQYFKTAIPQEIISEPDKYIAPFRRCQIENVGKIKVDDLIAELLKHDRCLCVVNEKEEAKYLYKELEKKAGKQALYCLTTDLTPYDRARYIAKIKQHLADGDPCIVVSTSLIECGVDLDFPYGYRELAGLDSVLQTAGRINRNGKLDCSVCKLIVFEGPRTEVRELMGRSTKIQDGPREKEDTTRALLTTGDVTKSEAVAKYFTQIRKYSKEKLDAKGILAMAAPKNNAIRFQDVAENFKLIDEDTVTVIVPQNSETMTLIDKLRNQTATRNDVRKVGKYSINVYRDRYEKCLIGDTEILTAKQGKHGPEADICCLTDMRRYTEYGIEF